MKSADIAGNIAGDPVSNEINDSKERQGGDTGRDFAGDSLPVGDGDAGELSEITDFRRYETRHIASTVGFFEDRIFGLATEADVSNATGLLVAANAVPVVAAVIARPRVEDSQVWLIKSRLEGQQRRPVRRRAAVHERVNGK